MQPESGLSGSFEELLQQMTSTSYPPPRGEDLVTWKQGCHEAFQILSERGLFQDRDSQGNLIKDTLLGLTQGDFCPTLRKSPGRSLLVGELLRNVADPGRINQGFKGTCAACCIESFLAERHPREYIRLLAGLMSSSGIAPLRTGQILMRDEDRMEWQVTEARRSPVSRLFQVAVMEFAYPKLDYRNIVDGYIDCDPTDRQGATTGLGTDAFDRLLEGITGDRWDTLSDQQVHVRRLLEKFGLDTSKVPDINRHGLGILRKAMLAGDTVFVTLEAPTSTSGLSKEARQNLAAIQEQSGLPADAIPENADMSVLALPHKVRVLGWDTEDERIIYEDPLDPINPWIPTANSRVINDEGTCSMSIPDFDRLMVEINYRPQFWSSGD